MTPRRIAPLALLTSLIGCVDSPPPETSDVGDDLTVTCPTVPTDISKSLVVTDPQVLAQFSFTRTLTKVLKSSGAKTTETTKQLFQSWMSTFGPSDCTNKLIDPRHFGEVCPRPDEAKLATVDPTSSTSKVKFVPVGLFNRFDLAPNNGANCGEYRIVYTMQSTDPNIFGRGFIIFEAALPNPTPSLGAKGCLPIAEFWQDLSADPSVTSRTTKLVDFYYTGTALPGVPAVVDAAHYGLGKDGSAHGAGQIRTNMFVDFVEWHLREFKTELTCGGTTTCTLSIDHVSAKVNPANELFDGSSSFAAAFVAAFPKQVATLAATDPAKIKMNISPSNDEYESVSQRNDVAFDQFTDAAMTNAIQAQLIALKSTLQPSDILRRATTQTCAGCHEVSTFPPENQLGGGLTWPSSLGFVQIDEGSNLSPALTGTFLPHRRDVLDHFIAKTCGTTGGGGSGSGSGGGSGSGSSGSGSGSSGGGGTVDAGVAPPPPPSAEDDDDLTLGGSPVGAAN